MKNKDTLLILAVIIIGFSIYYFYGDKKITNTDTNNQICTQDAKLCPNGSYVGRTGPNCTFAECPTTKTPKATQGTTGTTGNTSISYIKVGQRALINGVYITPVKVAYEGRCPQDVKCVQAGVFDLGVILESGSHTQNVIITLNKTINFAEKAVTLTGVTPAKYSNKNIASSDYRFTFSVK